MGKFCYILTKRVSPVYQPPAAAAAKPLAMCNKDVCFLTPTSFLGMLNLRARFLKVLFYHFSICFALSFSNSRCGVSVGWGKDLTGVSEGTQGFILSIEWGAVCSKHAHCR